jgi:hypothetical protein
LGQQAARVVTGIGIQSYIYLGSRAAGIDIDINFVHCPAGRRSILKRLRHPCQVIVLVALDVLVTNQNSCGSLSRIEREGAQNEKNATDEGIAQGILL